MLSCASLMHPDGQHTLCCPVLYAVLCTQTVSTLVCPMLSLCTQTVSILYYAPWQVAWPSLYPTYLFLTIAFFPDYHFRSQLSNSIPFYRDNLLLFVLSGLSASIPFGYTLLSLDIINYAMGWFRIDRVVLSRPFWCHHDDTGRFRMEWVG